MSSTADRVRQLVTANVEIDGKPIGNLDDLNVGLTDLGVSSVDVVSFAKLASEEFGLELTIDDCANIKTLQAFVEHIDAAA